MTRNNSDPPIPFVDLAARHAEVNAVVERAVLDVLRSGRWSGGTLVERAEQVAASWLGRTGAVGVASGTDALILGLQALDIGPGDEVIVPTFTFFATAGAVLATGAEVVLSDVGPDGLLDPARAADLIGPRTRAIIPVHLFGNTRSWPDLGLPVLDDAAQAIGTLPHPGGRAVALSTYPTKTWGSAGDGGFVASDDPELLERVRRLGNHGLASPGLHVSIGRFAGRASRLDAVQAAVLLGHAEVLMERIRRRRQLAATYDAGLPRGLSPLPRSAGSSVQQYVVRVEAGAAARAALQQHLTGYGIGTMVYYARPLHHQPALSTARRGPAPVAEALAESVLALPIHDIDEANVSRILEVLTEVVW